MRASAVHLDNVSGRQAILTGDGEQAKAKAVALMLHGGKEESLAPVAERQVAVMRMGPLASHLIRAGAGDGLAVWRLRFRYRGWNDAAHPIEDVEWAVRQMRIRHGDAPIVIVGHSMGGRAALRAAGENGVAAVLGLAPWLPDGEPTEQLAGRRILVVHGSRDRITDAQRSREFVREARSSAQEAAYIGLRHCGHAMMRRMRLWHRLTEDFVFYAGLGREPSGPLADALSAGDWVV